VHDANQFPGMGGAVPPRQAQAPMAHAEPMGEVVVDAMPWLKKEALYGQPVGAAMGYAGYGMHHGGRGGAYASLQEVSAAL